METDGFELLEGEVHELRTAGGLTEFRLAERPLALASSTTSLHDGERIRVLVRREPYPGFADVLVLQRQNDERIEYFGPRPSLALTCVGAALFALGLHADQWWLMTVSLVGTVLVVHQCGLERRHILRVYREQLSSLLSPTEGRAAPSGKAPRAGATDSDAYPSRDHTSHRGSTS